MREHLFGNMRKNRFGNVAGDIFSNMRYQRNFIASFDAITFGKSSPK